MFVECLLLLWNSEWYSSNKKIKVGTGWKFEIVRWKSGEDDMEHGTRRCPNKLRTRGTYLDKYRTAEIGYPLNTLLITNFYSPNPLSKMVNFVQFSGRHRLSLQVMRRPCSVRPRTQVSWGHWRGWFLTLVTCCSSFPMVCKQLLLFIC